MGTRVTLSRRSFGRNIAGHAQVAVGALSSAFGAVGWLSALRYPSLLALVVGFVCYGVLPLIAGLSLVWRGLDRLEDADAARQAEATSRAALLDAVRGGATAAEVARRLAWPSARDAERALDGLVIDDLARLDVTDDGDLVYRSAGEAPGAPDRYVR
jgi:hypothetical protein